MLLIRSYYRRLKMNNFCPSHSDCLFNIFFSIIVTLQYKCNIYLFFPTIISLFIEFHAI